MRQIAIIGLGNFGSTVAKELAIRGAQVIALDKNRDLIENIKDSVANAVALDTTDANALKAVGIQNSRSNQNYMKQAQFVCCCQGNYRQNNS